MLEQEVEPLKLQLLKADQLLKRMEYEVSANRHSDQIKIQELEATITKMEMSHRSKCKELLEIQSTQESFVQRLEEIEKGRDSFRSQYLEIREINKDLSMKVKALQKEKRAQQQFFTEQKQSFEKQKENIQS